MPPARPSTSSGPSEKASILLGLSEKPNFDKRLSKDDMFLASKTAPRRGLKWHHFGVRGGLPTPESSPGIPSSPMATSSAIPTRMHTPESLASGEIQIGMALGSPSHLPDSYSGWQPQRSFQVPAGRQPQAPPSPELMPPASVPAVQRQKTQKRKLFGNLFGSKKTADSAKAGNSPAPVMTFTMQQPPVGESIPARSNTVGDRRPVKHMPIIIRSNTVSAPDSPPEEPTTSSSSLKPKPSQLTPFENLGGYYPGSIGTTPSITASGLGSPSLESPNLESSSQGYSSLGASSSGPFLDVEIPSIKMERYSVMFDSLLNPQGTSSLLARRQATLEKLKTINDRIAQEEEERQRLRQRRATSPQPAKSPGLSLFPHQGAPHGASPLSPRRLMRSNTSPALLPSPSQPNFDREHHYSRRDRKTVTIVSPRTMDHRNRTGTPSREHENMQAPAPERGFRLGPDSSGLVLDSPESMAAPAAGNTRDAPNTEALADMLPLRHTIAEPQWQMVSPPPLSSSASSSVATSRRSPSSSASSVRTHITQPSVDLDEPDAALKTAVEISIARQISISRQQRTLLQPMKPTAIGGPAAPVAAPTAPAIPTTTPPRGRANSRGTARSYIPRANPIRKVTLEQHERVAETRFATPKLVAPGAGGMAGSHLAQHRKSERVVLEAA
ncbi:hypothetical protein QBC33DRAFT_515558 [Phialemonium atrogriseum]|uniref:Uncharacterized protein n=1 Tax=Phialemonium atrogriseum TaxID=1093897 RepID=A0AAJ0C0H4_9PEZI|nr:uncharacterized protein QBC33DRAFT_515558 [Phialemonium atrogriseum]KAK1766803.1 hypothetical protein QBC33DRAFT_515558 [Phialemonium atrogriseum]